MTWIPDLPPEPDAPQREIMEWLIRQFRQLSTWSEGAGGADVGSGGICSISGTPRSLSGSVGGAPIALDVATVPGKIIHANAADSGVNAVPVCLHVYNPAAEERPFWYAVQGGTIPVPTSRSQMQSQIIPPSLSGPEPVRVPCVLEPGYTLHVSADAGSAPMQLFGMVDEFISAGVLGYGGLIRRTSLALGNIAPTNWITIDFEAGVVTNPINIAQDPANNRFTINAPGIWFVSSYGTIRFDRDNVNDRVLATRFFNETTGQPVTPTPFPIYMEQGTTGAAWAYSTLFEVAESLVPGTIRQELGGEPTFPVNNIQLDKCGITLVRISPDIQGLSNPLKII